MLAYQSVYTVYGQVIQVYGIPSLIGLVQSTRYRHLPLSLFVTQYQLSPNHTHIYLKITCFQHFSCPTQFGKMTRLTKTQLKTTPYRDIRLINYPPLQNNGIYSASSDSYSIKIPFSSPRKPVSDKNLRVILPLSIIAHYYFQCWVYIFKSQYLTPPATCVFTHFWGLVNETLPGI